MLTPTPRPSRRAPALLATLAAGALALVVATPTPAAACGGFFCSQTPVDQRGEQILFSVEPGHVKATIQIAYQGEAEDFAWVIPVASAPAIEVAPQAIFTQLDATTRPSFRLDWDYDNGCYWDLMMADGGSAPNDDGGGRGVQVMESQQVGPYDAVTLKSDDAQALYEWLNANDFDQPAESIPLIEHYVAQDMLFVAMKLANDADAGDIQPVTLDFGTDEPCVPLILTRIAAAPDMPVRIWVLGEARAVPTNWMHVVIDQKKIDWLDWSWSKNYDQVVTNAVDEAAGHGFVTEFAGSSEILRERLWFEGRFDLEALAATADPAAFVQALLGQGFPRDAQMQALIREYIPRPADETLPEDCRGDRNFYATWNLEHCLDFMPERWSFDAAGFAAALEAEVVEPLKAAQAVFDAHPYLTRLYTTVSPEEMDRDPMFAFNPDLPDVSNVHVAQGSGSCGEDGQLDTTTITLETGETFTIDDPGNPWEATAEERLPEGPWAARVEMLGASGPPVVVDPSLVDLVDQELYAKDPATVIADLKDGALSGPTTPPAGLDTDAASSGCAGSGGAGGQAAIVLALLLALGLVRRRALV